MTGRHNHTAPNASATTRTRSETVTFTRPFRLSALDERQPPGRYTIETDEEMIGSVSFPAYQRTATWIRLPSGTRPAAVDRLVNVDPADLAAAVGRDLAAEAEAPAAPSPERAGARDALRTGATDGPSVAPRPGRTRRAVGFTVRDWLRFNKSDLTWIAFGLVALLALALLVPVDIPVR